MPRPNQQIDPLEEIRRRKFGSSMGTFIQDPLAAELPIMSIGPSAGPVAARPTPLVIPTATAGITAQATAPAPNNIAVQPPMAAVNPPMATGNPPSVQANADQMGSQPSGTQVPAAGVKKMTETDKYIESINKAMDLSPARQARTIAGVPAAPLGAMLGKAAQAIMGPYQNTPAAQFGKLATEMNEGQIYADALGDAREGREFTNEIKALNPEQQAQLYTMQALAQDRKMNMVMQKIKVLKDLADLGATQTQIDNEAKRLEIYGNVSEAQIDASRAGTAESKEKLRQTTDPNSLYNQRLQQELDTARMNAQAALGSIEVRKAELANVGMLNDKQIKLIDLQIQKLSQAPSVDQQTAAELLRSVAGIPDELMAASYVDLIRPILLKGNWTNEAIDRYITDQRGTEISKVPLSNGGAAVVPPPSPSTTEPPKPKTAVDLLAAEQQRIDQIRDRKDAETALVGAEKATRARGTHSSVVAAGDTINSQPSEDEVKSGIRVPLPIINDRNMDTDDVIRIRYMWLAKRAAIAPAEPLSTLEQMWLDESNKAVIRSGISTSKSRAGVIYGGEPTF